MSGVKQPKAQKEAAVPAMMVQVKYSRVAGYLHNPAKNSSHLGVGLLYPGELAWKPYRAVAGHTWPARSTITYARFIRLGAGNGFAVFGGRLDTGQRGDIIAYPSSVPRTGIHQWI